MEILIIFAAKYLFILNPLALFVLFIKSNPEVKKYLLKISILTFPVAFLFSRISSMTYNNPRPFVVENIQPLIAHVADNGFPSDHTLITATTAVVIYQMNKKLGILAGCVAVIVGIARVVAKVHHPVDIIGSIAIAVIAVLISKYVLKIYFNSRVLHH